MFKLLILLFTTTLAYVIFAQDVFIAAPKADTSVTAGSNITVKLDKPMSLTGSEEVAIVIGAFPCTSGQCPGAAEVLGNILYDGPYSPQEYPDSWNPYQNITVTIPSWFKDLVQLGVAHFFLLGAGLSPQLQLTNTTLNVVAST